MMFVLASIAEKPFTSYPQAKAQSYMVPWLLAALFISGAEAQRRNLAVFVPALGRAASSVREQWGSIFPRRACDGFNVKKVDIKLHLGLECGSGIMSDPALI